MRLAFVDMGASVEGARQERAAAPAFERVECLSCFAEIETRWLALQAQGVATPYQTFDWARAWAETAGAASGVAPLLATATDRSGRVVAILPLGLARRAGVTVASFLGGKHSNLNMGLFDRSVLGAWTRSEVERMLRLVAGARGVDLYALANQPLVFAGAANPLAMLPRLPSPSSGWATSLFADGEAHIRRLRSPDSLKKLRAKARKLAEHGPLRFVEAKDELEVEALLRAFLTQKAAQFAKLGVDDPFADPDVRAFLAAACRSSGGRPPAIGLAGLMAGDRIVAVFGGAAHGSRRSGMFMSYDADPAVARHSPGDLLLLDVMRASCAGGLAAFDLGVGDAPYKKDFCPEEETLFDSLLPMNARGRPAALALRGFLAAKRAAKRSPAAGRLIDRLRRLRAAASAG